MYPGVIIEYDDQSDLSSLPIAEVRNAPLYCAVFTSDKGTEDWTRISGKDFFEMYGKTISFNRHGQPLLQAAMSINSGAELFCKRLVADDATLANIAIVAKITSEEVQAKDAEGNLLYVDENGDQTTIVTGEPLMTTTEPKVAYSIKSAGTITDDKGTKTYMKDIDDVKIAIEKDLAEDEYLLYVITDIGRGSSKKRVKIVPNYKLSKSLDYVSYTLTVIEGSNERETIAFSINPNLIVNGINQSLQSMININSTQLRCVENVDGIEKLAKAIANATGIAEDDIYKYDLLFCCTNKGLPMDGISVDTTGVDLQYTTGQELASGDNGAFGDYPISLIKDYTETNIDNADAYTKAAVKAFDGSFDKIIFNVDQHKIAAVFDANYPCLVKRTIESLALFREDFMFFRDQNLKKTSYELIAEESNKEAKSMFCSTYGQSYDIIDPYSKRQIPVTICYSLAQLMVPHCNNGAILPPAGIKHDMVIKDAIYGTLSFAPTICPDYNEKEKLDDLRVNYASYIDNQLVIETLYTSQEKNTQWSYVNNVMGIQEVIRAIRTRCPAIRYSFIDGEDLEKYKAEVNEVIEPYSTNYLQLELEYKADAQYSANKIFYAVLKVVYKEFIQTEWFKVTALSTVTTTTA